MNKLYFGDCLDILKKLHHEHPEGFIDLIYIDPPFNSKRNYNILFEAADLKDTKAQKEAFADTWSNVSYKDTIEEIKMVDLDLYQFLHSLDLIRISKSAVAYLTTMAIRIWYMHKVLKSTGSFYLHCDSTMSHYLKIICDLVFGGNYFQNEIIWKRKTGKGETNQKSFRYGVNYDIILFYTNSKNSIFNTQYSFDSAGYDDYLLSNFRYTDENGRKYRSADLGSPTMRKNLIYEYKGYKPPKKGWAISKDKMELWDKEGRLLFPINQDGRIRRKVFLDEVQGKPVQCLWDDISSLSGGSNEILGYPTQKPVALMERIISASSNEGDLVADFFCGCGTSVAAAQKLNRRWLGVDISHLAVGLISRRLIDAYGPEIRKTFEIDGLPKDLNSARELAHTSNSGRFKFQDWIIESMLGGVFNPKKVADGGWDGHLTFEVVPGKKDIVLIEVKSGHVNVKNLREFIHVVDSQNASMGIFVCFDEEVTKPMKMEAKNAGYYAPELFGTRYDRVQILTVNDLLEGKLADIPRSSMETFKKAKKVESKDGEQMEIF